MSLGKKMQSFTKVKLDNKVYNNKNIPKKLIQK